MQLKPLKEGSLIGIAAPAGPFDRKKFLVGVRNLERLGFRVHYGQDIFSKKGYLAGSDRRRARELNRLLQNRNVQAILFARGGYGSARILPFLSKRPVPPKTLVGLSDLTALFIYLWEKFRTPSLYGPMIVNELQGRNALVRLKRALTDPHFFKKQRITGRGLLRRGRARGTLVGGCLSLVVSTLGTPYELDTRGKLLFLEDIGEEPYRIDRMITQLIHGGKLEKVRGIVLGTFVHKSRLFPSEIRKVFEDRLRQFRGPVLWGVRFGHCPNPQILPFGGVGRIRGKELIIERGIF